jgi:hypothetical protein
MGEKTDKMQARHESNELSGGLTSQVLHRLRAFREQAVKGGISS